MEVQLVEIIRAGVPVLNQIIPAMKIMLLQTGVVLQMVDGMTVPTLVAVHHVYM